MKKIISIIVCAIMLLCFVSCGDGGAIKEYTDLKNNETLVVDGQKFVNTSSTVTTPKYISCVKDVKYELRRSLTAYPAISDSVEFGGYYYYWVVTETVDEEKLGDVSVKTDVVYSYLAYGEENTNINIRKKVSVETTYSYNGGFADKAFTYTVDLNGYFESVDKARELCPQLFELIDITGSRKYYVDTTTPTTVEYDSQSYTDTYFYFE